MDVMEDNHSVLNLASDRNYGILRSVLESDKDPDEQDDKGRTALHIAASRGWEDILTLLLEHGANHTIEDHIGNTPLHYCGHVETIQSLLDSGADPVARNKHGDTPIELMTRRGVECSAIDLLRVAEDEDQESTDDVQSQQPLVMTRRRLYVRKLRAARRKGVDTVKDIWFEFCQDLGPEKLILLLIGLLLLSLYVAYFVTTLAKHIDTRIPIEVGETRVDL